METNRGRNVGEASGVHRGGVQACNEVRGAIGRAEPNVRVLCTSNDKFVEHSLLKVLLNAINLNRLAADWSKSRQLNLSDVGSRAQGEGDEGVGHDNHLGCQR